MVEHKEAKGRSKKRGKEREVREKSEKSEKSQRNLEKSQRKVKTFFEKVQKRSIVFLYFALCNKKIDCHCRSTINFLHKTLVFFQK